jgi:hypothetical protein
MGLLNMAALYLKVAVVTSDGCCSCPLNAGLTLPGARADVGAGLNETM